jgi:TIR domain
VSNADPRVLRRIFISYSHADKTFVDWFAGELEQRGFDYWRDEKDLVPGDDVVYEVSEALHSARVVIIVISAASQVRPWLRYELSAATNRAINGVCRVIPLLIDGTSVPAMIQHLLYADFRSDRVAEFERVVLALNKEAKRVAESAAPSLRSSKSFERFQAFRQIVEEELGRHRFADVEEDEFHHLEYEYFAIEYDMSRRIDVVYHELSRGINNELLEMDDVRAFRRFIRNKLYEEHGLIASERRLHKSLIADLYKVPVDGVYYALLDNSTDPASLISVLDLSEMPDETTLRLRLKHLRSVYVNHSRALHEAT